MYLNYLRCTALYKLNNFSVLKKIFLFVFIGNGKPKQSTSRCAVEISEIVNRIAPQVIVALFALVKVQF